MICAVHAVVGAAIGKASQKHGGAFAAGVASHLLCDLMPHKDFDPKTEAPLLAATLGVLAWKCGIKSPEFVGALGAVAPDLENAASVVGWLPRDQMRFPTHRGEDKHGRKLDSAWTQGILATACLAYVFWPAPKK